MKVSIVEPPKPKRTVVIELTIEEARALACPSVHFADCCRVERDAERVFRELADGLFVAGVHGLGVD